LLNELVRSMDAGEHYLEVGSWRGRTLLSAAVGNPGRLCIGCDKFRLYGRYTGLGVLVRRALRQNVARHAHDRAAIHFYDMPSSRFFARPRQPGPVGVYFYDGDHSFRGTRRSIAAAGPLLSRRAVVLVDDWNVERIRLGALQGFADASLRVLWHRALRGDHTERTWWNGLGVFYVERGDVGEPSPRASRRSGPTATGQAPTST
jgi:hypothetical protein